MRLGVLYILAICIACALAGCKGKGPVAAVDCGWITMDFVMSEQALQPAVQADADRALTQTLEGLGFKRSPEQPWRFDAVPVTSVVRYLVVEDSAHSGGLPIHADWAGFRITPHGRCGSQYNVNTVESYLGSMAPKILAALQPYSTEKVKALGVVQTSE